MDVVGVEWWDCSKGEARSGQGGEMRASFSASVIFLPLLCESSLLQSDSPPWELLLAWKLGTRCCKAKPGWLVEAGGY